MFLRPSLDEFQFYCGEKSKSKESILLLVVWLGNMYTSCFFDSSRLVALELIEHLAAHLDFSQRLNYVLPLVREAFASGKTKQETENFTP